MDISTDEETASKVTPVAPAVPDPLKHEDNAGNSKSDLSHNDDNIGDDDGDDYDDYMDEYMYEDDYTDYQSQFDNVDLPAGVEVEVPWLKDAASLTSASNTTVLDSKGQASAPVLAETTEKVTTSHLSENLTSAGASSSAVPAQPNHEIDKETEERDAIERFKNFKLFDVVEEISDHHYSGMEFSGQKPSKTWAKKIQDDWNILEKNLPGTIFVRVCEKRMELLRAVIVGPSGTPYHDGLFVFDCIFPPTYPEVPPMVFYYSGGLRLNPNLYACGKVCLSLLGTWSGKKNENWVPSKSTMLQVLVSIQALILNEEPFFNEPGYDESYKGETGKKMSVKYSEEAFIMSLKTMMYTMRRPPKHFEDLVIGHFRECASDILVACRAYADGANVGSFAVVGGVAPLDGVEKSASPEFRSNVKKMINILIKSFTQYCSVECSVECEQFRVTE